MSEILLISDNLILLSATLIAGITIIYAIKKWLSASYTAKILRTSSENGTKIALEVNKQDLNSNDNHYSNGNVIKVNEDCKESTDCLNDNKSEESELIEVIEEIIKCESVVQTLESELPNSDLSADKCDIELELFLDEICVNESAVESKPEEVIETKVEETYEKVSDLAAIILTDDNNTDWYEIVCITSGSDIINSNNLEPEFVVIDCRAPVLARRCLIRYLYHKLNEVISHEIKEEDSLFAAIPGTNRFELKKNYKLNLYLSQPPDSCKTKTTNGSKNGPTNGPTNGLKKSENKLIQLKSTTDKISVWNQVGVQGALLSHFIDAIYINCVIIGVEFNEKSFHQHFILNYTKEPKLLKCENILIRDITEKVNRVRVSGRQKVATNWIKTEDFDDRLELIDCETGKAIESSNESNEVFVISRLSKHELNKCFREFRTNCEFNLKLNQSLPMTYRKWKESAPNYRLQKQLLKVRYAVAGRQWRTLQSDLDLDMFV